MRAEPGDPLAEPVARTDVVEPLPVAFPNNSSSISGSTFVETPRYTGAVYRASGWLHAGTTQGAGATTDKNSEEGRLVPAPPKRPGTPPRLLESAGSDKLVTG